MAAKNTATKTPGRLSPNATIKSAAHMSGPDSSCRMRKRARRRAKPATTIEEMQQRPSYKSPSTEAGARRTRAIAAEKREAKFQAEGHQKALRAKVTDYKGANMTPETQPWRLYAPAQFAPAMEAGHAARHRTRLATSSHSRSTKLLTDSSLRSRRRRRRC